MDKKSDKTYIKELIPTKINLLLIAVIFVGAMLRVIRLNSREIFYDDGFSFWLSIHSFRDIVRGTAADTMPPLYYFLLHIWSGISYELWFLRLLNVILSLITLVFIYKLSSVWFGKTQGLLAVMLAAILPFQIYHAQELRMYVLLLLGQIGYFYYFYTYISSENNQVKNAVFTLFFGLIAMYSHNLAIFGLITVNLYVFLDHKRITIKKLALVQGLLLIGFIPWLIYLPQQITKIQTAFWTPKPGILEVVQAVLSLFSFLPMSVPWTIAAAVLIFQSGALVLYWAVRNGNKKRLILIGMIFLPGLFLFIVSYLMRPVFVPRALITSSILFLILVSEFVFQTWKQHIGKFVLVSLVISAMIGLPFFYQFEAFPRSSFHKAAQYLEQTISPEELILHDNKLSFFPMLFYAPQMEQTYLSDELGSFNDTLAPISQEVMGLIAEPELSEVNLNKNVYYVVFEKAIEEYQTENLPHPGILRLKQDHQLLDITRFGDLHIYYFKVNP